MNVHTNRQLHLVIAGAHGDLITIWRLVAHALKLARDVYGLCGARFPHGPGSHLHQIVNTNLIHIAIWVFRLEALHNLTPFIC